MSSLPSFLLVSARYVARGRCPSILFQSAKYHRTAPVSGSASLGLPIVVQKQFDRLATDSKSGSFGTYCDGKNPCADPGVKSGLTMTVRDRCLQPPRPLARSPSTTCLLFPRPFTTCNLLLYFLGACDLFPCPRLIPCEKIYTLGMFFDLLEFYMLDKGFNVHRTPR